MKTSETISIYLDLFFEHIYHFDIIWEETPEITKNTKFYSNMLSRLMDDWGGEIEDHDWYTTIEDFFPKTLTKEEIDDIYDRFCLINYNPFNIE